MHLILFNILNVLDAWLTKMCIANGAIEANPIMALIAGTPWLYAKGLAATIILIVLFTLCRYQISMVFKVANVFMVLIVIWNTLILVGGEIGN